MHQYCWALNVICIHPVVSHLAPFHPRPQAYSVLGSTMPSCHELVQVLLYSTTPAEQQEAAAALAALPMDPCAWRTLVNALPDLVGLIQRPLFSAASRQQLVYALNSMADFAHMNGDQIEEAAADVIASIVQLLKHSSDVVQCVAASALRELSLHPNNLARVIAAGAVEHLVQMLKSMLAIVQADAVSTLAYISRNSVEGARSVVAAGAIPILVLLLRPSSIMEATRQSVTDALASSIRLNVLVLLGDLAAVDAASRASLFDAGIVPRLVEVLRSDCEDSQCKAAGVIGYLACEDPGNQIRIAAASEAVPPLIKLLASRSEAVHVCAASALGNIVLNIGLHAQFTSAGAIASLLRLLRQSKCAMVQKLSARVLMGLALGNDTHTAAYAAAIIIPHMVQLLQSESATVQMLAVNVLTNLVEEGVPENINTMKQAGALSLLAKLKGNSDTEASVREEAVPLLQLLQSADNSSPAAAQKGHRNSAAPHLASSGCRYSASLSFSTPSPADTAAGLISTPSLAASAAVFSAPALSPAWTAGGTRQPVGKPRKSCWSCGATGMPLKKCSVCAVASYCGAGCQKMDWKVHKGQCTGLKAGASVSGGGTSSSAAAAAAEGEM